MNKLEELVKEVLENGLYICGVGLKGDSFGYDISGFAKSGYGTLYQEDGVIKLQTRYNQVDVIEDFDDIVSVAYGWDRGYCSKGSLYGNSYGVSVPWAKVYIQKGYDISNLN